MIISPLLNFYLSNAILFLSPHLPIKIQGHKENVWFSKQKILEAQALPSALLIKSLKRGSLYASGLGSKKDPLKIVSTTAENLKALKKCGLQSLEIKKDQLWVKKYHSNFLHCHFSELYISKMPPPLLKKMHQKEKLLRKLGYSIRLIKTQKGQRHLYMQNTAKHSRKEIKKVLDTLNCFYKIHIPRAPLPGSNLHVKIRLFEVSNRLRKNSGLLTSSSVSLHSTLPKLSSTFNPFETKIFFQRLKGKGRILTENILRIKPGHEATFSSGGEIPLKSNSAYSSQISWKNYGLQIKIKIPTETQIASTEIHSQIEIEHSEPDLSTALEGIPGLRKRSLKNRFDLRIAEESLLGKLHAFQTGKQNSGPSLLSGLPILGRLFKNTSQQNDQSTLYITAYPYWEEEALYAENL